MSPPDMSPEDEYLCVGICMPEPDSGYCLGLSLIHISEPTRPY